jgi:hypothetical protein
MQKPGLFGMNGFIVFLLTSLSFAAQAQEQKYMILLDAENKQPFIVRVGNQSYFSSVQGHLVLSRLKDSTYKLGLRFPRKNIPEKIYTVAIHRKDLGFQLKGNDSSVIFINWQSKDILRPAIEKDSSRMLEQGIKKDDGFSRLMAAVVNDTAVLYNTYADNGFVSDSAIAKMQNPRPKTQNPTAGLNISRSKEQSAANQKPVAKNPAPQIMVPANPAAIAAPVAARQDDQTINADQHQTTVNRDSVITAKRLEMHIRDSLNTVSKRASRDSLIYVKKRETFLRDSLNTARKVAFKDSMAVVKKRQTFLKDSLVAVRKASKDSLQKARKNASPGADLLAAKRIQQSKDSLLAVQREKAEKDSLLAVERQKYIQDSIDLAARVVGGGHHSSLTRVKKIREVSLKISRKMVFLDIGKNGHADTITLFVYFESADLLKKRPAGEPVVLKKQVLPDTTGTKKSQIPNKSPDTIILNKTVKIKNSSAPSCDQSATEADTEALRSAILKANSEQEKIAVAAGAFALKCFSVNQVRFLTSLLVTDKAKYGMMNAAHFHVVDEEHFPELVDMFTDKNFQRKFLVMAEKRS